MDHSSHFSLCKCIHKSICKCDARALTVELMTTISKVAQRAGVSRTTVSHVLNHAHRVSKPLRERVLQAIDDLGYVPNPQAQSLRTGRTNTVAMLIPDIRNPFYTELVKEAQSSLEAAGLDMLIFNTDVPGGRSQEHGRHYLQQVRQKRVDGLIVGDFALHGMHDALLGIELPVVFIGDLPNHAVDSIQLDNFGGSYQMGIYLAGRGHRRVAMVTGPAFFREAMTRADGFEKGLADGGAPMDPDLRYEGTYLEPSGVEFVSWLLDVHGKDLPDAVFFGNYLMALGGLAAFHDHGVRIPEDVSVAVFGDQPQMDYLRPRLTRVGSTPSTLAERATQMLLERLAGKVSGEPRTETLSCVLKLFDTA
jgi:DNA-binding LacI/PurR family transcriptional regulator